MQIYGLRIGASCEWRKGDDGSRQSFFFGCDILVWLVKLSKNLAQ